MADRILRFTATTGTVRGEAIELDRAWQEIVARHSLPDAVRDLLGELTGAALLLAASIKHEGALILQIHGDGPVRLVVVECRAQGTFRATIKFDPGRLTDATGFSDLVNVSGGGRCAVTLDTQTESGDDQTPNYQGVVPLDGDSVSIVIERYMALSEQIPTRIWLSANEFSVRGLMLQRMPNTGGVLPAEVDTDCWNRFVVLAETLRQDELQTLSSEALLHRLFWQESMAGADARSLQFACRCSRDKVADMLRLLGPREVEDTLAELGNVEVRCEFCNQAWQFDPVDCAALFIDGIASGSPVQQ